MRSRKLLTAIKFLHETCVLFVLKKWEETLLTLLHFDGNHKTQPHAWGKLPYPAFTMQLIVSAMLYLFSGVKHSKKKKNY